MAINLTDQDFDKKIKESDKLILVDFWATWCYPCSMIAPILERIEEENKDKIILAKVDIDKAPGTAQNYEIDRIPTIFLFKDGKPISSFIGIKSEDEIKKWLKESEGIVGEIGQKTEKTIKEYEEYAKEEGFKLNPDKKVLEKLITGILGNEKRYGKRYCPCRRITGDLKEDEPKICPCIWHKEEIEKNGHCLCCLFFRQ